MKDDTLSKWNNGMIYKQLGKTGEKVSAIGIGTWKMGVEPKKEIEAIREAIENGVNFIDTAEIYGTEHIVRQAIESYHNIMVSTKVSPSHFHYDDVIKACNASLQRLGVRQIDLYQLHWPNPKIPIKETMQAMEELKKQGKIRHIGVSNFSIQELKEAQAALKSSEIVSNQVEYSVIAREPENGLLDYCKKEHITLIAYSPLGRGLIFEEKYKALRSKLEGIGKKYNKTASQVALNWLIMKEPVIAIPKASRAEHAVENAKAASFRLSEQDIEALNSFLKKNGI